MLSNDSSILNTTSDVLSRTYSFETSTFYHNDLATMNTIDIETHRRLITGVSAVN
jgi:hypothetical protein